MRFTPTAPSRASDRPRRSPRSLRRIGERRVGAHDDAHRAVEAEVVPGPAHQHAEPVLEADQVVEVDDEPHDPAEEAGEAERADLPDGRRPTDRRERALVAVAERARPRSVQDLVRDEAAGLHRGRRQHREHVAVPSAARGDVADRVRARRRRRRGSGRRPRCAAAALGGRVEEVGRANPGGPHHRRRRELGAVAGARHRRRRPTTRACRVARRRRGGRARAGRSPTGAA